jgi:hypothetical protein
VFDTVFNNASYHVERAKGLKGEPQQRARNAMKKAPLLKKRGALVLIR